MKYYYLYMDVDRKNDIICHYDDECGIPEYSFETGKPYSDWDGRFEFYYEKDEGNFPSDYLANDKGWFVVSKKLKDILLEMNTEVQYFPVRIFEKRSKEYLDKYFIANILTVVDALCLEKSDYFETNVPNYGAVYTISKYGIFPEKTEGADVFKLFESDVFPIFVSERFAQRIRQENITGIYLKEIAVADVVQDN